MVDLKVVHLNTYDGNGGAGRACFRLNNALREAGVDSEMWAYYKFGRNPKIRNLSEGSWVKLKAVFNILAERYLSGFFLKKNAKTPFSLQWFGKSLKQNKLLETADIIHIHWINHGFLTPKNLAALVDLEKPIVWTFHDSNAFTGGCHVRYHCENYLRQCGNCPLLCCSGKNDLSHKNWLQKQRAYSKLNFSIVAPSRWMANSIKQSSLLAFRNIFIIPNTIEIDVFKPSPKNKAKLNLKIGSEKFVLMSGFMPSKNDKHKGACYLLNALYELASRPEIPRNQIELLIFGNKDTKNAPSFPFKTTFLGTTNNDELMAQWYSAADVFISPSLEDNLPNTVLESLACGTPVVGFDVGGIPDMVKHLQNGYVAKYKSAIDLADGIEWLFLIDNRKNIQKEARKTILTEFAPQVIASEHLALYEQLLAVRPK